jgi:hypothetical protein
LALETFPNRFQQYEQPTTIVLLYNTNAIVCTPNIKKSLANQKSPFDYLIEGQSVENNNITNKKRKSI